MEKSLTQNFKQCYDSNTLLRMTLFFFFPRSYKISNFKVLANDFLKKKYPEQNTYIHIIAGMQWLEHAYEKEKTGVPGFYNLNLGWSKPYPETTGYIIPTFFEYIKFLKIMKNNSNVIADIYSKAVSMANWLIDIQSNDGSFPSGVYNPNEKNPNVFNTGQIIIGLLRAYKETKNKKYLNSAERAGQWLINSQDKEGTWTNYTYEKSPRSYHSMVSMPLLLLYKITKNENYKNSSIKNIYWVLKNQRKNFWFDKTNFFDKKTSLTHTLAYTLEGLLGFGIILKDKKYIDIVANTANKLMRIYEIKKYDLLPALFDENWKPVAKYSCLTGCAQISIIWSKLYKLTGDIRYFNTALKINSSLKKSQILDFYSNEIRGGIKGSYPIYGAYMPFSFPNWATKFFVDALILEDITLKEIELRIKGD